MSSDSKKSSVKKKRIVIKRLKPKIDKRLIAATNQSLERCNQPELFDTSFEDRINMDTYVLPNNKSFPDFVTEFSRGVTENPRKPLKIWKHDQFVDINPFPHQKFVSDFLNDNSPYRGLLLYHGLGSGKSGASIMTAEGFRNKRLVIMLPKSIRKNYEDEIATFGDITYRKQYHWCFIPVNLTNSKAHNKKIFNIFENKGVSTFLLKQILTTRDDGQKGIWMIDTTKTNPNYDRLTPESRDELDIQIEKLYKYKYTFIHYNAGAYVLTSILKNLLPNYNAIKTELFGRKKDSQLSKKDKLALLEYIYNPETAAENPFNNKVIIIDEIHNLSSMMAGNGFNGPILYEMIMRAKNCRIILLSGTPVINYSYELAIIFNMLRGYIDSYRLTVDKDSGWNAAELRELINRIPTIDRFIINPTQKHIEITRNPVGFINNYSGSNKIGVRKQTEDVRNDFDKNIFITNVVKILEQEGYVLKSQVEHTQYSMFPSGLVQQSNKHSFLSNSGAREESEEIFNQKYIDYDTFKVKDSARTDFKSRILGLVSHYNEISGIDEATGSNYFPEIIETTPEETSVHMSDYQFKLYSDARDIERDLEEKQKRKKSMQNDAVASKSASYFRVLSRQTGIFVFPPTIHRPRPTDFKNSEKNIGKHKSIKNIASNITKEELKTHLLLICNAENDTKKQELIAQFVDDIRDNEQKLEILSQMTSIVSGEQLSTFEEQIDLLCSKGLEICGDYDDCGIDIGEEIKYNDACMQAIDALEIENLLSNSDAIYNLATLSPKYAKIIENIGNTPGLVFGYSQFRSVEGIEIFSRALMAYGYSRFLVTDDGNIENESNIDIGMKVRYLEDSTSATWTTVTVTEINDNGTYSLDNMERQFSRDEIFKCYYALWTGTESIEQRSVVQEVFNSMENMYGQRCLILLATSSGAEGISLKNVRQVHIMEPYWNRVRTNQVIGRARRIKSHIHLKKYQQNVKVFEYIIQFTPEQLSGSWGNALNINDFETEDDENEFGEQETEKQRKERFQAEIDAISRIIREKDDGLSSDESLTAIAEKKSSILYDFLKLIKEAAIDCNYNKIDNLTSNPEEYSSENFRCFNVIPGVEGDPQYVYKLEPSWKIDSSATESLTTQREKILIQPLSLSNGKKIFALVFIDEQYDSVRDMLNIGEDVALYNYYHYYNLDYKTLTRRLHNRGSPIGYIKSSSRSEKNRALKIEYTREFTQNLSHFAEIHDILNENDTLVPPSSSEEEILWSEQIRSHHQHMSAPDVTVEHKSKWTCLVCADKPEYTMDTLICPICNVGTPDIFEKVSQTKKGVAKKSKSAKKIRRGAWGRKNK